VGLARLTCVDASVLLQRADVAARVATELALVKLFARVSAKVDLQSVGVFASVRTGRKQEVTFVGVDLAQWAEIC
jgi:hypothetical protein